MCILTWLKRLGIGSVTLLLLIFCIGITGCKIPPDEISGNTLLSDGKLISDNLPKEGMTITGFTGEAIYSAIPRRGEIDCRGGAPASEKLMPPRCEPGSKTIVHGSCEIGRNYCSCTNCNMKRCVNDIRSHVDRGNEKIILKMG